MPIVRKEPELQAAAPAPKPIRNTQRDSADIVAEIEPSVSFIHDEGRSSGTGFAVTDRWVVTNAHVIDEMLPEDVKVYFPSLSNSPEKLIRVLHFDESRDLCLVEVTGKHKPIRLVKPKEIRKGEDIIIIGSPAVGPELILKNAVTKGLLSSEVVLEGKTYYQISASINPGNSGGPVVNQAGALLAVVTSKASKEEGIAFGVPVGDLESILMDVRKQDDITTRAIDEAHLARVICRRIWNRAVSHSRLMEIYCVAMQKAIDAHLSASDGLELARTARAGAADLDAERQESQALERSLRRLQKASTIDSEVRSRILELWACSQEIFRYIDDPRGSFDSYRKKTIELQDIRERLGNRLSIELDIELAK
ncbi:MAG: serine protease [Phycisphaerae bacterium]|nr:serine protease [Phycisphaerae bacterium]